MLEGFNCVATFGFKIKYHEKLGIYLHEGYLIDKLGYRIKMAIYEVNYNDIFYKVEVGQEKF